GPSRRRATTGLATKPHLGWLPGSLSLIVPSWRSSDGLQKLRLDETGKPLRSVPSGSHAYRWIPATVTTSGIPSPSRSAMAAPRGLARRRAGRDHGRDSRRLGVRDGGVLELRPHRPAGKLLAVRLVRVDEPVLGGEDELLDAIAVQVGVSRLCLATRAEPLRIPRAKILAVGNGGEDAPIHTLDAAGVGRIGD